MHPPRITGAEVLWNPFEDIVPRSTREEREAAAVEARCARALDSLFRQPLYPAETLYNSSGGRVCEGPRKGLSVCRQSLGLIHA